MIAHFKWVNCMYELYLNEAVLLNSKLKIGVMEAYPPLVLLLPFP